MHFDDGSSGESVILYSSSIDLTPRFNVTGACTCISRIKHVLVTEMSPSQASSPQSTHSVIITIIMIGRYSLLLRAS